MCVFSHVTLFMHKPEEIEILQDAVDFVSFLDQYSPFVMFAAVTASLQNNLDGFMHINFCFFKSHNLLSSMTGHSCNTHFTQQHLSLIKIS